MLEAKVQDARGDLAEGVMITDFVIPRLRCVSRFPQ